MRIKRKAGKSAYAVLGFKRYRHQIEKEFLNHDVGA